MQVIKTTQYPSCLLCCDINEENRHTLIANVSFFSPYINYQQINRYKSQFGSNWAYEFLLRFFTIRDSSLFSCVTDIYLGYNLDKNWMYKIESLLEQDITNNSVEFVIGFNVFKNILSSSYIDWQEIEEIIEFYGRSKICK